MDVGNKEVWAVNKWNEIYKRTGIDSTNPTGSNWEKHQGEMTYVSSAEEGIVWAIDDDHDVWVLKAGVISVEEEVDNSPTWNPTDPSIKLVFVDAGKMGGLVGLKDTGCSFMKTGITNEKPQGENNWWDLTNEQGENHYLFSTIAYCQTGNLWATDKNQGGNVYFRMDISNEFPAGSEWVSEFDGSWNVASNGEGVKHISCGFRGYVFATTVSNTVYKL